MDQADAVQNVIQPARGSLFSQPVQDQRVSFTEGRVGNDDLSFVASKPSQFPARPLVVGVIRVGGGLQRASIGEDSLPQWVTK